MVMSMATCSGADAEPTEATGSNGFMLSNSILGEAHEFAYDTVPQRIVSLASPATEMLLALGLEENIASYAMQENVIPEKYQAAFDSLHCVTEDWTVSQEMIMAMEPDFLMFWNGSPDYTYEFLTANGMGTYTMTSDMDGAKIQSVYDDFTNMGRIFCVEERAARIISEMKAKIDPVAERMAGAEPMSRLSNKEIARQMAVVAQENAVSFDFSVMEIMLIGLYARRSLRSQTTAHDTKLCEDALASVGMLDFKNRSFLSLSGGEKQKVLIASAFSREPELIVLDEPTNHLDVGYQFLLMDLMKSRPGVTIFTSIHDMNMAMQYCDRIIALKDGEIYCTGTPREVLTPENLKELFRVRAEILEEPGKVPYIRYIGARL